MPLSRSSRAGPWAQGMSGAHPAVRGPRSAVQSRRPIPPSAAPDCHDSPVSEDRLAFPRHELRRRTVRGAVINGSFLAGTEVMVLLQGLIVTVLLVVPTGSTA